MNVGMATYTMGQHPAIIKAEFRPTDNRRVTAMPPIIDASIQIPGTLDGQDYLPGSTIHLYLRREDAAALMQALYEAIAEYDQAHEPEDERV